MAVSFSYRWAVRNQKRKRRRFEVILFFALMAMGLSEAGDPVTWRNLAYHVFPYIMVIANVFRDWRWQRTITVTSLDDRAMNEYGVEFEQATEAQQKNLLKRYRVGTYLLNYFPDEYEEAREREAYLRAYAFLRFLLPAIAALYWLGWKLLPEGDVRAAWTNGPAILTWLILFVLALPQMLAMWMEPDDPNSAEPKLVEAAQKEA
jgi:hypothetical protein